MEVLQRLNLLGCIQCGVCTGSCPISLKSGFNVRKLVRETLLYKNLPEHEEDVIWGCTTCSTCEVRCPREIKPFELVVDIRSMLVEEGVVPPTIRDALESVYKHGNPWGRVRGKRSEWAEGLNVKQASEGEKISLLYFVGCTPAYDNRIQNVARALIKIFEKTGTDFRTLGNNENCCGSEVYGIGEKGLFELLVEENLNLFNRYDIKLMVTTSPHCYNIFKNKYNGLKFEVQHYTQYIAKMIEKGKLKFSKKREETVTYHDPCFLGKKNGIYEEPRLVIENIPGVKFVEMERSKSQSLCCEGGGGRMWFDFSGERLSEVRVKEAVQTGASILLTSCPFCLLNLEDAVKTTGMEETIKIMDIAEFIAEVF
ncbi:hypothetical protein DRO26_00970 [Candidatus Bathyarchaeota archaeon]|nr:MAG: hypothetical protein DRO26_00970 [Candidatus Bathyarchaeota archaeon]